MALSLKLKSVPTPSLKTALCMVAFSVGNTSKFCWTVGTLFDQDWIPIQADRASSRSEIAFSEQSSSITITESMRSTR